MREVREGWKRVKFGDVVRLVRETCGDPISAGIDRVVGLEHIEPGDLRIRSWKSIEEGTRFNTRMRPGQVAFGKRRAYQRKVAVADFEAVCSSDIYLFESADRQRLVPKLLPYICQTEAFLEHAVETSAGSISPRTSWKHLSRYEFSLPPICEQERLARLLRGLWEVVEGNLALVGSVNAARKSLVHNSFASFPEGEMTTLGTVASVRQGTYISRRNCAFWGGKIPFLRADRVHDRRITHACDFITEKAVEECVLGSALPVGTSLMVRVGSPGKVARLGLPAYTSDNFLSIVPGFALDSWYLFYYLESQHAPLQAYIGGTAQKFISCGSLSAFPLRLPSLERQRDIVAPIRKLDDAAYCAADRLEEARRLLRLGVNELVGTAGEG